MSGVEAVDIIADVLRPSFPKAAHDVAEHVVSVLAASGHTIVPTPRVIQSFTEALTLPDGSILLDESEQPWAVFMLEDAADQMGESAVQKNFPMTLIRTAAAEEDINA